jgi:hypothetical protein
MRACFLGENICTLGFGVAIVQTTPLKEPETGEPVAASSPDWPLENLMARELRRRREIMEEFLGG